MTDSDTDIPIEFPPVDPTNFDLIIIGTSLPSSLLSAATSSSSKSVLHVDPNPFYGSLFSSLSPSSLSSLLLSPPPPPPATSSPAPPSFSLLPLTSRSLFSHVSISGSRDAGGLKNYSLDVAGPRVLFCADSAVDLMLKSGINNYMEFKAVDLSLIYDSDSGGLVRVPDSRAAIFKDRGLSLMEKNQMMKFLKLVQQHLEIDSESVISEEDLESPFFVFLSEKMQLPKRIQRVILYAIALADYDQENLEACKDLLKTKDGISRLALYHSSIGRFPNAPGAMLYPMYGQGELPQAFCRRAAVKGCIYVLRMPVAALLTDKDSGIYRGVRLASGQDVFSQKLVIDPQLVVPQALALPEPDVLESGSSHPSPKDIEKKVARAVCITGTSIKSEASNLSIVYPPRYLSPEQATSVRALQLSSNAAVCPLGMFVVYLSALCDDASQGTEVLTAALNALFTQPASENVEANCTKIAEKDPVAESAVSDEQKPVLVWSALYVQDITERSVDTISSSPSPDGNLSYNDLIVDTEKVFKQMFPGEEFFPEQASVEETENNEGAGPE